MVAPPSIASTTHLRKSSEYGFAIHAGLIAPAGSLNHIGFCMGIPIERYSGTALGQALEHVVKDGAFSNLVFVFAA